MTWRRSAAAIAVVAIALGAGAPAHADPPRPTNYRSEVTETTPPLPPGVTVEVVGGDAFLELTVTGDHRVIVPDYGDDQVPYLRFGPDGTVERNRRANATAANETRFGTASGGPSGDASWEVVATDGSYAWHDHRIHWMSPNDPEAVDAAGRVDLGGPNGRWEVPLVVDGTPTVVTGQLWLEPAPSAWPWVVIALAIAGATYLLLGGGRGRRISAATLVAGVGALLTSWATWRAAPAGTGASAIPMILAAVAITESLVSLFLRHPKVTLIGRASAAAALLGWSLTRLAVLGNAVLPTDMPAWMDRGFTVLALGIGAGAAALLIRPRAPETAESGISAERLHAP